MMVKGRPTSDGRFCRFDFEASGDGRQWTVHRPMAFWRNFAELDLTGVAWAVSFIARHGDPFGELERDRAGSTEHWPALKTALEGIAQAWEPSGRISNDPARRLTAREALYELARPDKTGLADIELVANEDRLVPRARTLRAFMIASAASALERGITMRVCQYCLDYFELRKSSALYCSGSCQAAGYHNPAFEGPESDLKAAIRKIEKGHGRGKHK